MSDPTDLSRVTNFWNTWANWFSLPHDSKKSPLVPESLDQPILPWTFAGVVVNETNSGNPQAEQAILSQESYGSQLGQLSDALEYLLTELASGRPIDLKEPTVVRFLRMKRRVDAIKSSMGPPMAERILRDIERLKKQNPRQFAQCVRRIGELDQENQLTPSSR